MGMFGDNAALCQRNAEFNELDHLEIAQQLSMAAHWPSDTQVRWLERAASADECFMGLCFQGVL